MGKRIIFADENDSKLESYVNKGGNLIISVYQKKEQYFWESISLNKETAIMLITHLQSLLQEIK